MAAMLNLLIKIGPVVFLMGLVVSIALVAFGFTRRGNDRMRWLGRSVLGLAALGVAALFAGAALGIAVFCSSEKMGNLCGLGGVFGSGPLLAGVSLAIYAYRRVSRASSAP
ncbi:MAG TPA: hypothetical protein VNM24_05960 [Burkholderiales bacterium]|nr:hypothetical protein [Burkholderiales bacterium]